MDAKVAEGCPCPVGHALGNVSRTVSEHRPAGDPAKLPAFQRLDRPGPRRREANLSLADPSM